MKTFYNDRHALHHGRHEMFRGKLVPCVEVPDRADFVLRELRSRGLGEIASAPDVDLAVIERVHAKRYLDFLSTAWEEWIAMDPANAQQDALPSYWPIRTFRSDVLPASFPARMGLRTTPDRRSRPARGQRHGKARPARSAPRITCCKAAAPLSC